MNWKFKALENGEEESGLVDSGMLQEISVLEDPAVLFWEKNEHYEILAYKNVVGGRLILEPTAEEYFLQLYFCLSGSTTLIDTLGQQSYEAGQCAVQRSGLMLGTHQIEFAEAGCQALIMYLSEEFMGRYTATEEWKPVYKDIKTGSSSIKVSVPMQQHMDQLLNCSKPEPWRRSFIDLKVAELLLSLLDASQDASPVVREPLHRDQIKLVEAKKILDVEFRKPPTIVNLSRRVGLNEFKLKKIFRQVYGTTIRGYITNVRMGKAQDLLLSREYNIAEVADLVGYGSPSHFTLAYKKHFNYLPSDILQSMN
ncbi:AraC-like DNA-binding protein [Dyadobacter jejuensis]|uniref:AraC-like DNA-binding protein n=1 Tax=Dyadobacter jejuensis TaxID=1082580 RepID=A0A316AMA8_9BACT|nr:AraC family transcriptional regulator [Dyadobacter jejuensis]PWJ58672.1 AraC-like DNA-binding protein [Dyadobacter jejuensis]